MSAKSYVFVQCEEDEDGWDFVLAKIENVNFEINGYNVRYYENKKKKSALGPWEPWNHHEGWKPIHREAIIVSNVPVLKKYITDAEFLKMIKTPKFPNGVLVK